MLMSPLCICTGGLKEKLINKLKFKSDFWNGKPWNNNDSNYLMFIYIVMCQAHPALVNWVQCTVRSFSIFGRLLLG